MVRGRADAAASAFFCEAQAADLSLCASASDMNKAAIILTGRQCLDAQGVGCEAWEAEINDRVAALYGL